MYFLHTRLQSPPPAAPFLHPCTTSRTTITFTKVQKAHFGHALPPQTNCQHFLLPRLRHKGFINIQTAQCYSKNYQIVAHRERVGRSAELQSKTKRFAEELDDTKENTFWEKKKLLRVFVYFCLPRGKNRGGIQQHVEHGRKGPDEKDFCFGAVRENY